MSCDGSDGTDDGAWGGKKSQGRFPDGELNLKPPLEQSLEIMDALRELRNERTQNLSREKCGGLPDCLFFRLPPPSFSARRKTGPGAKGREFRCDRRFEPAEAANPLRKFLLFLSGETGTVHERIRTP